MLFEDKIKKLGYWDIVLTKLAVFLLTLFLVVVWPGFRNLVLGIDWYWFLGLGLIATILVYKKMFS